MNLVQKMRNYIANFFMSNTDMDSPRTELLDVYLERVLRILGWESTEKTLRTFFLLNSLFWLTLMLNLRFYGIVSLLALITFIFDHLKRDQLYLEHTGRYANIIGDLKQGFHNTFQNMSSLRRESPFVFYSSMSLFFLTLQMIGRSISGHFILYLTCLGIFFLPVCLTKLLPEEIVANIQIVVKELVKPGSLLAEDELMPYTQAKDSNNDLELESLLTDKSQDSFISNLASGLSSMPSYLEVAGEPDDIQEEDLIPCTSKLSAGITHTPGESSSESDSEHKGIKFDSDHFNTSSSEEDFTKGMPKAINESLIAQDAAGPSMFRSMMNTMGSNIMTNMFQSAIVGSSDNVARRRVNSDSDSDFEIVDANEIAEELNLKKND